jgi:hypothetical protein
VIPKAEEIELIWESWRTDMKAQDLFIKNTNVTEKPNWMAIRTGQPALNPANLPCRKVLEGCGVRHAI